MSWYHISDSQHTTLQIVAVTHVEVLHTVLWRFPERFLEWFSRCSLSKQLHRIGANPLLTWLFCFQKSTNPGKWSSAFFSRDLRLLGSNIAANRRPRQAGSGHQSSGPWARGKHPPCGFPLLTNIKDLAFASGHFCYPLFVCHFVVVQIKEKKKMQSCSPLFVFDIEELLEIEKYGKNNEASTST